MSKRSPKSVGEKLEIVLLYLNHHKSIGYLAKQSQVSYKTIQEWIRKYKQDGIDGLYESRTWKKYSQELKEQAVLDYLEGRGSQASLVKKYGISDRSVLRKWINIYTSGNKLKSTSRGYSRMKKGRKTTFEERLEAVNFTIAHDKNYQAAIEKYGISYQQIYSWVRKFEKEGSRGLEDRRGKGLESKSNLTNEEELLLKLKQLEERNRLLEMENGLLKKLQEIDLRNMK